MTRRSIRTRPIGTASSIRPESTRTAIPSVQKAKPRYIGLRLKRYGPWETMRVLGLNGIGSAPGALLDNKAADVQCKSGEEDYCARNPSERAMHKACWHKPFEHKRHHNWQNE